MITLEAALGVIANAVYETQDVQPFNNTSARFKNDTFEVNAYDWSSCKCGANDSDEEWTKENCECGWRPQEYNFKWRDFEVSWYKYLGRGMSTNRTLSTKETNEMIIECLTSLNG